MTSPKRNYREGDWFAVPLTYGGWAVGVIARAGRKGVLVGYFFGPRHEETPSLKDVTALHATDAMTVFLFGHLGILGGAWPIIGPSPRWARSEWPLPDFGRYSELGARAYRVTYSDEDPSITLNETVIGIDELNNLPEDGLMGATAVEKALSTMLGG